MTTITKIKKDIVLKVKESMLEDFTRENIYNDVKILLKEYHQKPLGKKFLKDLEKLIPEADLRSIGSMLQVEISEKYVSHRLGHETKYKMSITLSHGETFNFDDLDRKNTCYIEAEHERIKKNTKFLKNEKLINEYAENILAMQKAFNFFNEKSGYDIPCHHGFCAMTEIEFEKRRSE